MVPSQFAPVCYQTIRPLQHSGARARRIPGWTSHSSRGAMTYDLHFTGYPKSVAAAGGLPVELTRDADVEGVVERIDGLVLSGGADLDPAHYGAAAHEQLGPLEADRDDWEFALLRAARERGLPVLAICRGMQLVNVAFGGTLNQHVEIDEGAGHPQWDVDGRTATHSVVLVEGTLAASLLPATWRVYSLHHQTVDQVGEGLVVSAHADDGVIEGLETPAHDLLAVQCHPELLAKPDPPFGWVVGAAATRRA